MELLLDVKRDYLVFMLSLVLINRSNSICAVYLGFMHLIRKYDETEPFKVLSVYSQLH